MSWAILGVKKITFFKHLIKTNPLQAACSHHLPHVDWRAFVTVTYSTVPYVVYSIKCIWHFIVALINHD